MPDLRPLRDTDVADVLTLNERNVVKLAPMDEARLHELRETADRFDVLDVDGAFAGFVITFAPGRVVRLGELPLVRRRGTARFYYLDRIVLHEGFRRRGLGGYVYDEIERVAAPYTRLALEVNLVPRNDASLAFHAARGYREVGRLGDDEPPGVVDGEAAVTPERGGARRSAEAMWAGDAASRALGMELVEVAPGPRDAADDGARGHGQRARDRARRPDVHAGRLGVRVRLQLLQPQHGRGRRGDPVPGAHPARGRAGRGGGRAQPRGPRRRLRRHRAGRGDRRGGVRGAQQGDPRDALRPGADGGGLR